MLGFFMCMVVMAVKCGILPSNTADVIYFNGDILTMKGEKPQYIESLAVGSGKILHAGSFLQATAFTGPQTKLVNLRGKTMLPGFFDPHSHLSGTGLAVTLAYLSPQPDGQVQNFEDMIDVLNEWKQQNQAIINKLGWIIGFGYDDSMLQEKAHPDKHFLNRISTDIPVLILHQSLHMGVANSKALEIYNITSETADPNGGHYQRYPNTTEPTGVMQENAFFNMLQQVNLTTIRHQMIIQSQHHYAEGGFTTVQDGRTDEKSVDAFIDLAKNKQLFLDIYSYPDYKSNRHRYVDWKRYTQKEYVNRFRIAGGKLAIDGSIQAKTGWLKLPYFHPPHNKQQNYRGYPIYENQTELNEIVQEMFDRKFQILAHVNGDAAIQQFLNAVAIANKNSTAVKGFSNLDNLRTVAVHSQMATLDALTKMVDLKVIPSFFGEHTFYWGDWHRDETLGPVRAEHISPAATARKLNMLFTEHTDAPVVLPNALRMVWSIVNRFTRTWQVLGPEQRLQPYHALLTITRYASIQANQQKIKGTLERGKLADLVILSENPLKVRPQTISQILVLQTIKQGKSIYRASI